MITKDTVEHIAHLAALSVPPEKIDQLASRFAKVLEYVGQLNEVDTAGVEPTSHVVQIPCPMREDKADDFDSAADIVSSAPECEEGFFKVPKVL